jgi:FkbM family methyltransferase
VPKAINETLKQLLKKCGFTVIGDWRLEHFAMSTYLHKLFEHFEIDCVLDVGAHLGEYHDFLRTQAGYSGKIVSFEPNANNVLALRERAKSDPRWTIEGCALGPTPGQAEFNIMARSTFSSFLEPEHSSTARFKGRNELLERVSVEVRTLDEVIPRLETQLAVKNIYLKLDTQGFDLEVLKGGRQTLPRIKALQTEASIVPIYKGMPDYVETIGTCRSLGFELSGMFPNNPEHFPRLIEFDCFLVNAKFLTDSVARPAESEEPANFADAIECKQS